MFPRSPTLLVVVLLCCGPAQAAEPLTLELALRRLREGPVARAIALRTAEAQGRLGEAGRLLPENPSLSGALGRRFAAGAEPARPEGEIQLVQPLGRPGERGARMRSAAAAAAAEAASSEQVLRRAEAEVVLAFYRGLAAAERERVATSAEATARTALEALERRHQLRDVALLDVNVSRAALARDGALLRTTRAERLEAAVELERLIGGELPAPVELRGDLRDQRRFSLPALLERAGQRADVRTLLAGAREAEAEAALGGAGRWPGLALGVAYEREEGANAVLGLLSLELPLFERGQSARAAGAARAQRLALEAELTRRAALAAVRGAHAAQSERQAAARGLEEVLPLLDQNEELARKSQQAGQLSLADWLVVRREALDTRLEYLTRLLAAAEAGVALALAAGVSP